MIPAAALDDPIAADPIRLVDADWDNGVLNLRLSQPVNADWTQVLQFGPYGRSSLMSAGPERFTFRGDVATVSVNSRDAQQAIDYFKSWLPHANEIYVRQRTQEKEKRERQQREALEREIKAREEREAVRGRLRI